MPIPKKVKSKKEFKKTGKIGTSMLKNTKAPKKKVSKTTTAKESFENYVKYLLKESFGLIKRIVG